MTRLLAAMTRLFFLLAALASLVDAYSNTAPLLVWSSSKSNAIDRLPTTATQASVILDSIVSDDAICNLDAVILVQHPGVHASDLKMLTPDSAIGRTLSYSPSTHSYPYVLSDQSAYTLSALAPVIANQCHSRLVEFSAGDSGVPFDHSKKHTIVLHLPALEQTGKERYAEMERHSNFLADELNVLSAAFPDYMVVYAGLPLETRFSRATSAFQAPSNSTLAEGGILARYQLLTPGLITVLLVVLFVFIPVLFIGINALACIQNPIKLDLPKGFNAQEKKNQ